jgi:hypothetical protein
MNFNKLEKYELSNIDIQKILGKIPIIQYPKLKNYKSINELLNNKFNAFVLFYETEASNVGHWCCCFKNINDGIINYFDSYGLNPLQDIKSISKKIRIKLKEVIPYLQNLLNDAVKSGQKIYINKNDYQSWKGDVSTCGRWVSTRLLNRKMNDEQFFTYISKYTREHNFTTFDDSVCDIIYNIIGK